MSYNNTLVIRSELVYCFTLRQSAVEFLIQHCLENWMSFHLKVKLQISLYRIPGSVSSPSTSPIISLVSFHHLQLRILIQTSGVAGG
jgi:hypothetical protein